MKKLLLLAFAFLALSVTFTSCSKDDDTPDSLVGTAWFLSVTVGEVTSTTTLNFTTATEFTSTASFSDSDEDEDEVETGTYVYAKPKVTLTFASDDIEEPVVGTVNGNKMTFTDQETTITFTKK
jgi:hypothetical protein